MMKLASQDEAEAFMNQESRWMQDIVHVPSQECATKISSGLVASQILTFLYEIRCIAYSSSYITLAYLRSNTSSSAALLHTHHCLSTSYTSSTLTYLRTSTSLSDSALLQDPVSRVPAHRQSIKYTYTLVASTPPSCAFHFNLKTI